MMADDSMEISSDHGQGGDEDIDIDIDITTGQIDEDDILEDVTSNLGGDAIDYQPQDLGADDPMVDEHDSTYLMNDLYSMNEMQEANMDDETPGMSFDTVEGSHLEAIENVSIIESTIEGTLNTQGDLTWEEGRNGLLQESDDHLEDEQIVLGNGINHAQIEKTLGGTGMAKAGDEQTSRTATPHASTPTDNIAGEPDSQPTAEPNDEVPNHESVPASPVGASNPGDQECKSSPSPATPLAIRDIAVYYQSNEYALFGAPESDDPDSFFLSDLTIVKQPISEFFRAIREVIHEDLAPEEELCLTVDDLGLELEEVVSSLNEVTLTQLFDLHQKLQLNDKAVDLRPLCISLGTKPSFARRLANLIADAEDGKGLPQLMTWDEEESEELEVFQETDEVDEYSQISEQLVESDGQVEQNIGDGIDASTTKAPINSEATIDSQKELEGQLSTENPNHNEEDVSSRSPRRQGTPPQSEKALVKQDTPKKSTLSGGDVDEDGDLIDYSDDEGLQTYEESRVSSSGAQVLNGDNTEDNEEWVAVNENLRRSSQSRGVSERQQTQELTPSATPPIADDELQHQTSHDDGNEQEREVVAGLDPEITDEHFEYPNGEATDVHPNSGNEGEQHEHLTAGVDAHIADELSNNDHYPEGEEFVEGEEENQEFGNDILDYGDVGDQDADDTEQQENYVQASPPHHNGNEELQNNESNDRDLNAPTELHDDRNQLLFTQSDETAKDNFEVVVEEDHDEIGYEDEEEANSNDKFSEEAPLVKLQQLSPINGATSKRPRADLDSDEAMTSGAKDAKRRRS